MRQPMISIIIPTYNRALIIGRTLDSIASQTYQDWECIIVDDGSTDETEEVAKEYSSKDKRFKFYKRPKNRPKGANACRNYGFELSKGEFINWFDSDDTMHKQKLLKQLELLKKTSANYVISQSMRVLLNKKNREQLWNKEIYSKNLLDDYICFKISWGIGAVLYSKFFLEEIKIKFNEDLQQSQEYDFHIRLLSKYPEYEYSEEPLMTVYSHDDSISYSSENLYTKAQSSLDLKMRLLKNKRLKLKKKTKRFLIKDIYRVFFQSVLGRHFKTAFLAYKYFLKAHFYADFKMKMLLIKHFTLATLALLSYFFFNKGYRLLNLSFDKLYVK